MTHTDQHIIPPLRFPEFQNMGEWKIVRLDEIAEFYKGKGIAKKDVVAKGEYPCVRYGELYTTYTEVIKSVQSYTDITEETLCFGQINDILIPSSGETKEDISTASCLLVEGVAIGGDINIIRTLSNGVFLSYYLNHIKKHDIASIAQGMSIIHLYNEQLRKLKITIPSTVEQEKIANCLMSLDICIELNKKQLVLLKTHKRGLMQRLFPAQGKTTPAIRFPEFQHTGEWKTDTMERIFEIKNGYTPSKSNPHFWEGGTLPWFRMDDIRKNGHILSDSIQHITPEAVKGSGLFPANSIIVATTATIGEHALVIVDSLANQRFTFLSKCESFDNQIDMLYFHYYMFIIDEWCKANTNSGGLPSVNMPAFKRLQIPYPPTLAEQQRIAACFLSIDKQIDQTTNYLTHLQTHKKGIMQQLFPK